MFWFTVATALVFVLFARGLKVPWAAISFIAGSGFSAVAPQLAANATKLTGVDGLDQKTLLVAVAVILASWYGARKVVGSLWGRRERHLAYAAPSLRVANTRNPSIEDAPALVAEMRASFRSGHTRGYATRMAALKGLERLFVENEAA